MEWCDSSNDSDDNEWSDVAVAMIVMTMSGVMGYTTKMWFTS